MNEKWCVSANFRRVSKSQACNLCWGFTAKTFFSVSNVLPYPHLNAGSDGNLCVLPSNMSFFPNNRLYITYIHNCLAKTTITTFNCTLLSNRVNWIAKLSLQNSLISQHSRNCSLLLPDSQITTWVNAIAKKKKLLRAISYYALFLVLLLFQYSNQNNNVLDISSTNSRIQ